MGSANSAKVLQANGEDYTAILVLSTASNLTVYQDTSGTMEMTTSPGST